MYTAAVSFKITQKSSLEKLSDAMDSLSAAWRMNGQILGRHFPSAHTEDSMTFYVNLPEKTSLDSQNDNGYVEKFYKELMMLGVTRPAIMIVGKEPDSTHVCTCKEKDYILYTNYLTLESPLRCKSCFGVVPLYRIPKTYHDEYYDIIVWQSDYQACDSLQMNCKVGERWATNQLSKVKSALSKQGLEVCQKIESATGKKVYYYLYKDKAKSIDAEKNRLCPSCEKRWYQEKELHGLFHFVCDACRLLSNVAWDI